MSVLIEGDFELDGYRLGGGTPVIVSSFDPGMASTLNQDVQNPVGSNRLFGRDFRQPPVWAFQMVFCAYRPGVSVLDELSGLRRVWDREHVAPGVEQVLRYRSGGRVRRVYGRSRSFAFDPNYTLDQGVVRAASGEFATSDALHYADEVESLRVTLVPGDAGGLVSPLVSPLTTVAGGQRQGIVTVGGDAPAPMEITFRGPVSNPVVSSTGWRVALNASLAYDQSVTVDTRRGTVLRSDGASLGGALSRHTYLPEARLLPGAQEIVFTGSDPTGTASCTVAWRPTYYGF